MRWRTLAVSAVLFAVTLAIPWIVVSWLRHDDHAQARPRGQESRIADAARFPPEKEVVVRGFVFIDANVPMLLCSQRTTGDRPACSGDVLRLEGLDTSRLSLERAFQSKGGYDAWSDGEVVLLGTTQGSGALLVKDVLPG
jgi:hypothetical protein